MDITEVNVCSSCHQGFLMFGVDMGDNGELVNIQPIVASHQGARAVYCPHCGVDLNSYVKEMDADLDKLNRWKDWVNK